MVFQIRYTEAEQQKVLDVLFALLNETTNSLTNLDISTIEFKYIFILVLFAADRSL